MKLLLSFTHNRPVLILYFMVLIALIWELFAPLSLVYAVETRPYLYIVLTIWLLLGGLAGIIPTIYYYYRSQHNHQATEVQAGEKD